ncbi:MAG: hypothetical protein L0229_11020 [Blastocatellia bacterium]|nr:hypothetical protein [Blastocatellia bacterium]
MSLNRTNLPDDFPDYLRHSEDDTPVPTWPQVTRSAEAANAAMINHVSRIIVGDDNEQAAREVWHGWSGNHRRSFALMVDKIYNEGWLDSVGQIEGWPWDGGFFFRPHAIDDFTFAEVMSAKSGREGAYTECRMRNGLFAYLNRRSHKGWQRAWMENDEAMAALHVGIFESGMIEAHLDVFNSLYTNRAPRSDLVRIPALGSYNHKLFMLHRRWEQSRYGPLARTAANFYHIMQGRVPLSF